MNKELEALEFICKILKEKGIDIKWLFKEQYNTIKQRLESIDNANPSEAFECLKSIEGWTTMFRSHKYDLLDYDLDTIKQTLIKSQEDEKENERLWNDITTVSKQYSDLMLDYQEQKKVLEIIKEKPLSVLGLTLIKKFDKDGVLELDYQTFVDAYKTMTEDFDEDMKEQIASQEEFELVKRYFK